MVYSRRLETCLKSACSNIPTHVSISSGMFPQTNYSIGFLNLLNECSDEEMRKSIRFDCPAINTREVTQRKKNG